MRKRPFYGLKINMIDQKKVELMTGMAMYEHTKKTSLKQNKYFEKDFRLAIALRSLPIGFIIGLVSGFIVFEACYEFCKGLYRAIGLGAFIAAGIFCVIAVAAVYVAVSVAVMGRKFENMRGGYVKYRLYQRELSKMDKEGRGSA